MSYSMISGLDQESQKSPLLLKSVRESEEDNESNEEDNESNEEDNESSELLDKESERHQPTEQNGAECGVPYEPRDFRKLFSSRTLLSRDELRRFRSSLFWLGLDQSTPGRICMSCFVCFTAVFIEPLFESFYVICLDCDEEHSHPFERLVQYSESGLALISFLFLSYTLRKNGLRKVLLLDKIGGEPTEVQEGYERKLHSAFRMLALILLPCFLIELAHKSWWFSYADVQVDIPYLSIRPLESATMCVASMLAWLYKTTVFLFVCILFRLMCSLQILRLEAYNKLLEATPDVSIILSRHLLIRKQLYHISHRFRLFLVASLFTITFSQFTSLFVITASPGIINFFRAGDLAVSSITQLTGIVICLHGAAKITHRAQGIVSIVSRWHAAATCCPAAIAVHTGSHDPIAEPFSTQDIGPAHPWLQNDDIEASYVVCANPAVTRPHDTVAYQQRQSLVTYLQHANAGISIYGFVLDRGSLYAIFGLELSLSLWILGKTVGAP